MTLQQIADYAMDYLDSKGIAAEYDILKYKACVRVSANNSFVILTRSDNRVEIASRIRKYVLNA